MQQHHTIGCHSLHNSPGSTTIKPWGICISINNGSVDRECVEAQSHRHSSPARRYLVHYRGAIMMRDAALYFCCCSFWVGLPHDIYQECCDTKACSILAPDAIGHLWEAKGPVKHLRYKPSGPYWKLGVTAARPGQPRSATLASLDRCES